MTITMSQAELIELGRQCVASYQPGFVVDDHTMTMVEGFAMLQYHESQRQLRIDRDGCCCEEGPDDMGYCRNGGGMCPLVLKAERLIRKAGHDGE